LLLVEGKEAEELRAEMEADEAEQKAVDAAAATAAMEIGTGIATTTDDDNQTTKNDKFGKANKPTRSSKPEPENVNAGRDPSQMTNTKKRSLSVTFAASADLNGEVDSHDHGDVDSYRSSSVYYGPSKKKKLYHRGR
jgi:hypothetical protein